MEIRITDFSGEIEWLHMGNFLYIDKKYLAIVDLINLSCREIEELAAFAQNAPIDEKKQIPLLKDLLTRLNYRYEQFYISDSNGDYFNADGQKNNIQDRIYFKKVMDGRSAISEPIINKSTGKPVIAIAIPIWRKGKVYGLFGATILITSIQKGLRYLPILSTCRKRLGKYRGKKTSKEVFGLKFQYVGKRVA
jgi:hypothetical protein